MWQIILRLDHPHLENQLQFLCGLGPIKAKNFLEKINENFYEYECTRCPKNRENVQKNEETNVYECLYCKEKYGEEAARENIEKIRKESSIYYRKEL